MIRKLLYRGHDTEESVRQGTDDALQCAGGVPVIRIGHKNTATQLHYSTVSPFIRGTSAKIHVFLIKAINGQSMAKIKCHQQRLFYTK